MMPSFFLTLAIALVPVASGSVPALVQRNSSSGCAQLSTQFPEKLYFPNTNTYRNESTRLWSQTCLLSPSCVFTPYDAADVASALSVIRQAKSSFSIRSGGHMPVPGAASTDNGVMIAMTNLNTLKLVENNTVMQIGPGNIWQTVYDWMVPHGLGVAGGRYGQVGVGGLLLGGGINYFGNRYGWSADSVVQYEVVLANSSIIQVTATSYPDLWWALKGGSNNFGIVTRFDMKTIPITTGYVGGTVWSAESIPEFLDAVTSFVQPGGGSEDPLVAINPAVITTPYDGVVETSNIVFHQGNDSAPASLANFTKIPRPIFNDAGVRPSWASLPNELNQPAFAARNMRQLFWSVGLKPTAKAISLANTTFIGGALVHLQNVTNCTLTLAYQPISQAWLEAARTSGGDAIDLDPNDGLFISGLVSTTWLHESDDNVVNAFSRISTAMLIRKLKAIDAYYPFIYLNDAAKGQDPFSLYGGGSSQTRLKHIRRRYDPAGVFNHLEASGFKLD